MFAMDICANSQLDTGWTIGEGGGGFILHCDDE